MTDKTEFDIVEEDPPEFIADRQRFAVIALTKPFYTPAEDSDETNKKETMNIALKIRGCFYYEKDAQELAKTISGKDDRYDVFICPLGKWLLLPPDIANISDQQHQDEMLSNVLNNHNNQEEIDRVKFEERKQKLMKEPNKISPQSDDLV